MNKTPTQRFAFAALLAGGCLALSQLQAQNTWTFDPPLDLASNYSGKTPGFDIGAILNEDVAGQSGPVTYDGHRFIRGDGQPIRFWGATVGAMETDDQMRQHARFIARRGMNLVRWHTSIFSNNSSNMGDVNMSAVDDAQRMVSIYKQEGVYTKLSYFFVLGLRIPAQWGVEGYTSQWLAANPDKANRAPFGLMFFDDTFKSAMKNWMRVLLTTPNPHDPNKTTLANDNAVAITEIQNEDNVFFWTFDPSQWPVEQQRKAAKKFGDWLKAKYGSVAEAQKQWGSLSPATAGIDDIPNGYVGLRPAGEMADVRSVFKTKRMADQIRFLTELQRDFFVEMREYCQNTLKAKGTYTGSNWTTANNDYLLDAEHYTYAGAGVIDVHNYFSPYIENKLGAFTQVSSGDSFYQIPGVKNPRRLPSVFKQVENHPSILSETTWTNPIDRKGEAAILTAAYLAQNDFDGWMWFASGNPTWESNSSTWHYQTPSMLGQFPVASLIYRRGDVAEAPTVLREGRTMESWANKQNNKFRLTTGYDPARPETSLGNTPDAAQLDTLINLVGKVEMAFDTDEDYLAPEVSTLNDQLGKRVKNITGQLDLDHGNGILTVDTPRTAAAVGFLNALGTNIETSQVRFRMRNEFGSLAVTALDGKPLNQSSKVLIQSFTEERYDGWSTVPITLTKVIDRVTYSFPGKQVQTVGSYPYIIDDIDATISLKWNPTVTKVEVLDGNGYVDPSITATGATSGGFYRITLPKKAMYTVLTITPASDTAPVFNSKALPNAFGGKPYSAKVEAIGGDGAKTYSVVSGLPAGLTLAANGTISGSTNASGTHTVKITATDADGDTATQDHRFVVIGGSTNPFAALKANSWVLVNPLGWQYAYQDGAGWSLCLAMSANIHSGNYPWIYHGVQGFMYYVSGDIASGAYFYVANKGHFYWMSQAYGSWAYNASTGQWVNTLVP